MYKALYLCTCVASYSLRRVRGTIIAAELEFVHCLIYFKNDVQRTIASVAELLLQVAHTVCCRSLMSLFSRPQPIHQEATQCRIHVRMHIFKLHHYSSWPVQLF